MGAFGRTCTVTNVWVITGNACCNQGLFFSFLCSDRGEGEGRRKGRRRGEGERGGETEKGQGAGYQRLGAYSQTSGFKIVWTVLVAVKVCSVYLSRREGERRERGEPYVTCQGLEAEPVKARWSSGKHDRR